MSKLNDLAEYGYDQEVFKSWLRSKSEDFSPNSDINLSNKDDEYFTDFKMLGDAKFDKDSIVVISSNSNKPLTETSSKRRQYDKAKEILKENNKYVAGLFVFYDSEKRFRLSFVYQESLGTKRKFSNFKRYTYFISPEETNKTFKQQLSGINFSKGVEGVQEAFSIDKVTKEFFKEYLKFFEKFVDEFNDNEDFVKNIVNDKGITTANFVKKMLGQIVFLYFIQKKGWMGVKENEDWGTGDQKFISNLINECLEGKGFDKENKGDNFYNDYLEHLFFETLANPDRRKDAWSDYFKCRIPYLNGGLFDDFYDWKSTTIKVSNDNLKELIEFLNQYNFTVDENTPDDQEISIDPEMLGRIFESLIGVEERKSKGAFYTPREIVQYMCRESIKEYLKTNEIDIKTVEDVVDDTLIGEKIKLINLDEIKKIEDSLKEMKVLDPAIGSGAFPIGILKEITRIRTLIKFLLNEESDVYDIKKEILEKNVYGVDIDSGAIEIARLRAWLSLIVDYDVKKHKGKIEPLPNLDFKFLCANTLIPLDSNTESYLDSGSQTGLFDKDFLLRDKLSNLRREYYLANTKRDKKKIQKEYKEHTNFGHLLASKREKQLFSYDPFTPMGQTGFYDSGLMHGVDHFDVVIGNPPYVDSETMSKEYPEIRNEYNKLYSCAKGNWDLFVVFIEFALNKVDNDGILSYIIPNKLIGAKYAVKIREKLASQKIIEIRDYSRLNVFKTADVYPVTILAKNNTYKPKDVTKIIVMDDVNSVKSINNIESAKISKSLLWDKFFFDSDIYNILSKMEMFTDLIDSGFEVLGSATVSEAYKIKEFLQEGSLDKKTFKFVNTGTIDHYKSLWDTKKTQYIKDSYFKPVIRKEDILKINKKRLTQAKSNKLIIGGMSKRIKSFFDKGEYLAGKSTHIILGEDNDLLVLNAILNSRLIYFYTKHNYHSLKMSGDFININKNLLINIPVPDAFSNKIILDTVNSIKVVGSEKELICLKNRLDDLVFDLYKITPEEREIILMNTE